jgi:peptidyl-prolyl cis-trans isomerase SurA
MNALESLFGTVVEVSLRASCLVLAVLALRRGLRPFIGSRVLFWAWVIVAIRLLLPVTISTAWSPFGGWSFRSAPAGSSEAGSVPICPAPAQMRTAPSAASTPAAGSPVMVSLTLAQWVTVVWLMGMGALLVFRAIAAWRFGVEVRRRCANELSPQALQALTLARQLAGSAIEVVVTDAVAAPALHRPSRPCLLLPAALLERLTPAELRLTIAHEVAHHRRRDLWTQSIVYFASVLHWFNPLVWLLRRVVRHDCELACDEAVVEQLTPEDRQSYGAALLRILRLTASGPLPRYGLGVVESKQQIKRRIEMITAEYSSTRARTLCACLFLAVLAAVSLTRHSQAQPAPQPNSAPPLRHEREVAPAASITDVAAVDSLDQLFPSGIVAAVGDKTVTVADVRREIAPLLPQLQKESATPEQLKQRLQKVQNSVISDLVGRILLIKEFNTPASGEKARTIAAESVDQAIADRITEQFGNDRAKFLEYLRSHGWTMGAYRQRVEEEIIYSYMRAQERKPEAAKPKLVPERTGQVHLRIIQVVRKGGATDAALLEQANAVLGRLKAGERFDELAKQVSADSRGAKGGDWGWVKPEDLRADYRDVVFALKKGEVSAPLVRPEGCFLLYVEERG